SEAAARLRRLAGRLGGARRADARRHRTGRRPRVPGPAQLRPSPPGAILGGVVVYALTALLLRAGARRDRAGRGSGDLDCRDASSRAPADRLRSRPGRVAARFTLSASI